MSVAALSGNDIFIVNNQIIRDLAVGTVLELTFPNEKAGIKVGKNGNAIYGQNQSGRIAEVKAILVRGSSDDIFLSSQLAKQDLNFAGTVLLIGSYVKKIGDGKGNITSDKYILSGGIFIKGIPAKTNTEGEAEQSQAEYVIRFAQSDRTLT